MKKIFYVIFLNLLGAIAYAQNPLNVVITQECNYVGGTFNFGGLLNGKNNYERFFQLNGTTELASIGFNGSKWILYANNDLTDIGFENTTVQSGALPPATGWIPVECFPGNTMTITQALSVLSISVAEKNISIYPNPATNYFVVKNRSSKSEIYEYKIIDISGRIVNSAETNFDEKIELNGLAAGNYIVEIKTTHDFIFRKKLIIQ